MATATAITYTTRPGGNHFGGTFTADLASIAAAGQELITATVPGAATTDTVLVSPQSALLAGLIIAYARVSAADTVIVAVSNHSAGAVDQASTVFNWTINRGSTFSRP